MMIDIDFYEMDADYCDAPGKSFYSRRYKDTIGGLESCRYHFGLESAFQRCQRGSERIPNVPCSNTCDVKLCGGGQITVPEYISGPCLNPHEQMHLSDKENSSNSSTRDTNDSKSNIVNAESRQADWSKTKEGQSNGSGVSVNSVPVIFHGSAKQVASTESMRNGYFVYNPVPIRRKSSKKHVPHEKKDTQYWKHRIQNNVAARRSRESRRRQEIEVMKRCKSLYDENEALRRENLLLQDKVLSLENLMLAIKKDLRQA